jgi:hypothetical protein
MTPRWLEDNAKIDADDYDADDTVLHVGADDRKYEAILSVNLFDRNDLSDDDDLTIKINAALEHPNPIASSAPRDPMGIMISDTRQAYGVQVQDPNDYQTFGPYRFIEGESARTLRSPMVENGTPLETIPTNRIRRWPQLFQITIKSNDRECLGSCYSAVDGGLSMSFVYSGSLRLSDGLRLELYRGELSETYNINYFEVSIFKDTLFK